MDETILYGYSYTDDETDDRYISIYRGIYEARSRTSSYPAVRHVLGINLTRRLIWRGHKYSEKVTEFGDDFIRVGRYTVCREINSVFISLGYSSEEITELLDIIASKSADPALKANGTAVSF
jgi:hypothetical protein